MNVPVREIGEVDGSRFIVGTWINLGLDKMQAAYYESLPSYFRTAAAVE